MYADLQKIKEVIDYIEKNITSDLDCNVLAAKMGLSVYEFRRIFSFIIGCPISEYIRKRRLSLAALEIMKNKHTDIMKLSEKYGYSSQSAFCKAFSEYHGATPTVLLKEKTDIKLFTVPEFEIKINSGECISLNIIKDKAFYISGFSAVSAITDSCCCENVWNAFYESGTDKKLSADKIYAAYKNSDKNVLCTIGERVSQPGALKYEEIPETLWACFKLNTVDDGQVNEIYSKLLCEWLPSAKLIKNNAAPVQETMLDKFDMVMQNLEVQGEKRMLDALAAKPAIFSYAKVKENIEDRDSTFEDLRQRYEADFPELSDPKTISWTVNYGKTTKSVSNPGSDKVYDIKAEIENSKAFKEALKKAKTDADKNPECIVKHFKKAQTKGEIGHE